MNIENGIAIIWLLPVAVQIVLPLIMLLAFGTGKLFAKVFGFGQSGRKANVVHGIRKPEVPTAGAMA